MLVKRKLIVWLTAIAVVIALLPNAALAAPGDVHPNVKGTNIELLGGTPEWVFFKQGNPPSNGIAAIWTLEELDETAKLEYYSQVIDIDKSVGNLNYNDVMFFYGNQIITNDNKNTGKYQVVKIGSKWYVQVLSGGLSHITYKEGEDPLGDLEVSLDVKAQDYHNVYKQDYHNVLKQDFHNVYKQDYHNVLKQYYHYVYKQDYHNVLKQDYHNVYKQDYHNVLKQDYHNVLKQDYHNIYKQDYHNVLKQDYHNVFKQDYHNVLKQNYHNLLKQDFHNVLKQDFHDEYIPMFEKKVSSVKDTLVSGITYGYGPDGKSGIQSLL